ncbi:MAG: radical domain protein, partial [Bacteroidetes bacterium]|nr:radical domain protein [Bacteroidota bacterium]
MSMDSAPVKALGKLFLWQNHKPSYILFFVTGRCEAACKHCFYWQKRNVQEQELTLAEIESFARKCGSVVQLTLTGGSPEMRSDLADIARVFWTFCRPLNITLCSNGNNPDKLAHDVRSIVKVSPECNLTVDISLDGLHEEHDTLRGVKGLFDRVLRSYEQLRIIRERHANLRIGCGLCVSGMNKHTALATARWAMEHLPLDNLTPILVRGKPQHP